MHLRRAISNRNATLLLRNGSSSLQSQRSWFHTPCSRSNGFFRTRYSDPSLSAFGFMQGCRRGFAKGKRSSTSLISLLLVFFFLVLSMELLLLNWRFDEWDVMYYGVEWVISVFGFLDMWLACLFVDSAGSK